MKRFNTVIGIRDEINRIRVLGQEFIFSEYRFKNLIPKDVIYSVNYKTLLVREEGTDKIIRPKHLEPCEVIINPSPRDVEFMLLWNRVIGRWELWKSNSNYWNIMTGEMLQMWLNSQVKEVKI